MAAHASDIMQKIHFEPNSGCWIFAGAWDRDGYGRHSAGGRTVRAHRYCWEKFRGPIGEGLVLDHKCRNSSCCNPDHLEPVTVLENTRRGKKVALIGELCAHGHPRTPENTYTSKEGFKACRPCRAQWIRNKRGRR